MKIGLALEYNVDGTGWIPVPNQIPGLTNNQTVVAVSPVCVNYIDFRMKARVTSAGMNPAYKTVGYTIMLKN